MRLQRADDDLNDRHQLQPGPKSQRLVTILSQAPTRKPFYSVKVAHGYH
jgi:hypothetical protein